MMSLSSCCAGPGQCRASGIGWRTTCKLMLRSLKSVYKVSAVRAVFGLGSSPDPGTGVGVELGGGDPGGVGDLVGVGEGLPGQRLAPEDPPPAFLHVQPAGAFGDEGVADAGMEI